MRDPRQIEAYLDFRLGKLSRHGLVAYAIELHEEKQVPEWAKELAHLFPKDILNADRILEDQLSRAGVLPDSSEYRRHIRNRIFRYLGELVRSDDMHSNTLLNTIGDLLSLVDCGYAQPLSIPILEYGCDPACSISSKAELSISFKDI